MPTLTAARELTKIGAPALGQTSSALSLLSASPSATTAPVIEAVRVPPSASITSQSIAIVRSPSAFKSTTARKDRPIRRLNLLGATLRLAARPFALIARRRGRRQHRVLGSYPPFPTAPPSIPAHALPHSPHRYRASAHTPSALSLPETIEN